MTIDPVDLDQHRSMAGRMATEIRRHSVKDLKAYQEARRRDCEELEARFLAEPATTWPAAVAEAEYLIRLYSETTDAKDSHRIKLIEQVLSDLSQMIDREKARDAGTTSGGN